MIDGYPLLWWSLKAFHDENPSTELIVVLPETFTDYWKELFSGLPVNKQYPHKITTGGKSRTESVKNGLLLIEEPESLVAIHDGARPLVSINLIKRGWEAASSSGAAVPAVDVIDSLRKVTSEGNEFVDRSLYVAVQTPQVFKTRVIKEAYDKFPEEVFSDDATAVEKNGGEIILFPGDQNNRKVTHQGDIEMTELLIRKLNG